MAEFSKRQQEIILASIELLGQKGMQEMTIKNIAKALHFTEPAVYRYFESKFDILLGILSFFEGNVQAHLGAIQSEDVSPLQKLERMFLSRCENFSKHPAMTTVIFSEEIFRQDSRLSKKVLHIMGLHQNTVETILKEGQEKEQIRKDIPKEHLALLVLGLLRLLITRWRMQDFAFDLYKEAESLWTSILKFLVTSDCQPISI